MTRIVFHVSISAALVFGVSCSLIPGIASLFPSSESSPDPCLALEGTVAPDGRFPALKICFGLPGHESQFLWVRFPEMIEARPEGATSSLKYYQDNRDPAWPVDLATEPIDLPVKWQGNNQLQRYAMAFDNNLRLVAEARVESETVTLSHTLYNDSSKSLFELKMWNCIQLIRSQDFADPLMERTQIVVNGEFVSLRGSVAGFVAYTTAQAGLHRFQAYEIGSEAAVGCDHQSHPHPGYPDDPSQAIHFWHARPPVDRALISTLSRQGDWRIRTSSQTATQVWSNPGITCHHADATVAHCPSGASATVVTRVWFERVSKPRR